MSQATLSSSRPSRRTKSLRPASRPAARPASAQREQVILMDGDWKLYEKLDAEIARPGLRVTFCEGVIQIMSISALHELIKANTRRLIEDYCLHRGIHFGTRGGPTHKKNKDRAGEPDESFVFERGREMPQLVIEVALTSGGLDKLAFWGGFPIEEVWMWKRKRLLFYRWDGAKYREEQESTLVPGLKASWIERFAEAPFTSDMLREFKALL